jgi:hypothetical protein
VIVGKTPGQWFLSGPQQRSAHVKGNQGREAVQQGRPSVDLPKARILFVDDAPVGGEADITQGAGVEIFESCGW